MEINEYTRILLSLEEKMDELQNNNKTKDGEIQQLKKVIEQVTKEKSESEERYNALQEKSDEDATQLKGQIVDLENRKTEIIEKVEQDDEKLRQVEKELHDRENEIRARDTAIERLSSKYKLVPADSPASINTEAESFETKVHAELANPVVEETQVERFEEEDMTLAQDDESLDESLDAGFGNQFPDEPKYGQLHTRTNTFPHAVYQYNGNKWIRKNEEMTDSYLTDEFIEALIAKIRANEISIEELSNSQQIAIENYLKAKQGN